jgi:excisionase family DNA binding protein
MRMRKTEERSVRSRDLQNQDPAILVTRPEAPPETAEEGVPDAEERERLLRELHEPKLTVEELARAWRVSVDTIWRDIRKGALRAHRTPGGNVRILLSDARAYGRPYD